MKRRTNSGVSETVSFHQHESHVSCRPTDKASVQTLSSRETTAMERRLNRDPPRGGERDERDVWKTLRLVGGSLCCTGLLFAIALISQQLGVVKRSAVVWFLSETLSPKSVIV